jgi:hypothetical protein
MNAEPPRSQATVATGAPPPEGATLRGVGERFGPWRIIERIGAGGMGVVYLAERADGSFDRKVALKVLRPGTESDAMQERFLLERQTLGALDHPHIARLLDAGNSDDGRPYFAMQWVQGETVDAWVARRRPTLRERIDLFLQVCDAVTHAHGHLVVHRDIKPSNILVDGRDHAHLLDFGIAKLLPVDGRDGPMLTSASERLLTPQFAAPEQVLGHVIGVAADVYALGMLLYVLLADALPYDLARQGPADMQRLICETMPPPPSERCADASRARALRGDLDRITLMALRKEPERRYRTAEQFAADLRRHLDGLPVMAQPDTFGYRTGKFLRRHRLGLASTVVAFLLLTAALGSTWWQMREAERARALAEQRFDDIRGLATAMIHDIDNELLRLPGSANARRQLVETALAPLDRLQSDRSDDVDLLLDAGAALQRIADVQGSPFEANLGDLEQAKTSAARARALRDRALALAPQRTDVIAAHAASLIQQTGLDGVAGTPEAELAERYAAAAAQLAAVMDRADAPKTLPRDYLDALTLEADSRLRSNEHALARQGHEAAFAFAEAQLAAHPDEPYWQRRVAVNRLKLANSLWWEERVPVADVIAQATRAADEMEALKKASPGDARVLRQSVAVDNMIAGILGYEVDIGTARPYLQRAIEAMRALTTFDPANPQYRLDLVHLQEQMASMYRAASMHAEVEVELAAALAAVLDLQAKDPGNASYAARLPPLRCSLAMSRIEARDVGKRVEPWTPLGVCSAVRACEIDAVTSLSEGAVNRLRAALTECAE